MKTSEATMRAFQGNFAGMPRRDLDKYADHLERLLAGMISDLQELDQRVRELEVARPE
ncbi:MAG: hypothetical protein AB7R90_19310 [Reyranellaceae bacterium]